MILYAMTQAAPRYAVYFAPEPETTLWRFGSGIIGYDAATGRDCPFVVPDGFDAGAWSRITEEPRRYGFHATLKAPFRLAPGVDEARLCRELTTLASRLPVVTIDGLTVRAIGRFCALQVVGDENDVNRLASDVTLALEPFRALLTPAEVARRLESALSERQATYLERYGYPYVLDEFRFHMTLTGPLDPGRQRNAHSALAANYAHLVDAEPVSISSLCLFRQASPQSRFSILLRAPLTGPRPTP